MRSIAIGSVPARDGGDDYAVWLAKGERGWNVLTGRGDKSWFIDGPHESVADAWAASERLFGKVREGVTA